MTILKKHKNFFPRRVRIYQFPNAFEFFNVTESMAMGVPAAGRAPSVPWPVAQVPLHKKGRWRDRHLMRVHWPRSWMEVSAWISYPCLGTVWDRTLDVGGEILRRIWAPRFRPTGARAAVPWKSKQRANPRIAGVGGTTSPTFLLLLARCGFALGWKFTARLRWPAGLHDDVPRSRAIN